MAKTIIIINKWYRDSIMDQQSCLHVSLVKCIYWKKFCCKHILFLLESFAITCKKNTHGPSYKKKKLNICKKQGETVAGLTLRPPCLLFSAPKWAHPEMIILQLKNQLARPGERWQWNWQSYIPTCSSSVIGTIITCCNRHQPVIVARKARSIGLGTGWRPSFGLRMPGNHLSHSISDRRDHFRRRDSVQHSMPPSTWKSRVTKFGSRTTPSVLATHRLWSFRYYCINRCTSARPAAGDYSLGTPYYKKLQCSCRLLVGYVDLPNSLQMVW